MTVLREASSSSTEINAPVSCYGSEASKANYEFLYWVPWFHDIFRGRHSIHTNRMLKDNHVPAVEEVRAEGAYASAHLENLSKKKKTHTRHGQQTRLQGKATRNNSCCDNAFVWVYMAILYIWVTLYSSVLSSA